MDIGRKIYYELATGNVLVDTGERQGDVIETTQTDDFSTFSELNGKDPSTIVSIQLNFGDRDSEFLNMGSMHVDPSTQVLTIYPKLSISADKTQITANGTDTATITVSIQDIANSHAINFAVNNGTPNTVNTSNGVATYGLTTTLTGNFVVTATSDLYGTNSITVTGV